MNKTIIGLYGRANEGKSETLKNVCKMLLSQFPNASTSISRSNINYKGDILISIQIGKLKIGIESCGDPSSRMIKEDTIRKLIDVKVDKVLGGGNIIICATRTNGETVQKVDQLAREYNFHTLWKSSYYSPGLNATTLNRKAAEEIIELINMIQDRIL